MLCNNCCASSTPYRRLVQPAKNGDPASTACIERHAHRAARRHPAGSLTPSTKQTTVLLSAAACTAIQAHTRQQQTTSACYLCHPHVHAPVRNCAVRLAASVSHTPSSLHCAHQTKQTTMCNTTPGGTSKGTAQNVGCPITTATGSITACACPCLHLLPLVLYCAYCVLYTHTSCDTCLPIQAMHPKQKAQGLCPHNTNNTAPCLITVNTAVGAAECQKYSKVVHHSCLPAAAAMPAPGCMCNR
jgi:hypothetical protein